MCDQAVKGDTKQNREDNTVLLVPRVAKQWRKSGGHIDMATHSTLALETLAIEGWARTTNRESERDRGELKKRDTASRRLRIQGGLRKKYKTLSVTFTTRVTLRDSLPWKTRRTCSTPSSVRRTRRQTSQSTGRENRVLI